MKELVPQLDAWTAEGQPIARAVVVRSFGSAPRPEGAVLVITGDLACLPDRDAVKAWLEDLGAKVEAMIASYLPTLRPGMMPARSRR